LAATVVLGLLIAAGLGASARSATTQSTEVVVWDWNYFPGDGQKSLSALDRAFMKANPDIRIKHIGIPFATAYTKIRTAVAARKGPDVVTLYPGTFAADYRQGLVPLNSRIPSWMRQQVPLLRSSAAPDGNIYALPFTAYGYAWVYNKALFKKAGLNAARPPATWQSFLQACTKLRAAGIEPISAAWKDGYFLEWFLYVYGGQLLSKGQAKQWASAKLPVNNPKFVRALDLALSLIDRDCFQEGAESRVVFNDMNNDFTAGKAAMLLYFVGADEVAAWEDGLGAKNVGLFLAPPVPGSQYKRITDVGPASGHAITNWSDVQDEAWKYISFLQTRAAQATHWRIGGELPNNRTARVSSKSATMNQMLGFLRLPDNYTIYTGFPASILSILDQQAPRVVSGDLTTKQLLDQMEQAMKRLRPSLTR
jgi:ABC-type glycerol-3-phosphate transport system substrate-binding protein